MQSMRGDRIQDMLNRAKTPGARPSGPGPRRARLMYLLHNLVHFTRLLHRLGLDVQAGRTRDVAAALAHVDVGRRSDFYHTLRSLLVHRVDDLALFDEAFRVFWRRPHGEWTATDLSAMGETRRSGPPEYESEAPPEPDAGDAGRRTPARLPRGADGGPELQRPRGALRQGLRALLGGRGVGRRADDGRARLGARRAAVEALDSRAGVPRSTCGGRCAPTCATAASCSTCRRGGGRPGAGR